MTPEQRARTRALNDQLRQHRTGGRIHFTPGVSEWGLDSLRALLDEISRFDDFSPGNDPYGEHDFGALMFRERQVFWKIDYLDAELQFGAPDPSDEAMCVRVLTVMLAEEY